MENKVLSKKDKVKLLKQNLEKLKNPKKNVNRAVLYGRVEALLGVLGGFDYKKPISDYSLTETKRFLGITYFVREGNIDTIIRLSENYLETIK